MTLAPITPAPGICFSDASYATGKDAAYIGSGAGSFRVSGNRWVDATNVEFVAGFPQKIAGWSQATTSLTTGIPRAVCVWRDNSGNPRVGIGTETHLYYLQGSTLVDITPLRTISSGTLTNPVSTTSGSQLVDIADAAQTLVNGDYVFLSAATAVGGVTLNGWYPVSSRSGAGYQVTVPVAATGSAGPAGGTVTFKYPRVTLTNPFTTTLGSAVVTVHHITNGAGAGDYVTFSGASAIGGLTIDGEYRIASIVDSDHYTIAAASVASSGATGGGSVSVIYDITIQQAAAGTPVGYGRGAYGVGVYGAGIASTALLANGWTLNAYGNQLLGAPIGGTIYVYNPVTGGRAYPLLNAPAVVNAMFVTPERFVVALGVNGNSMQLAWADQNDYTVWTTTPTNTANTGRTLIGGSFLVGGVPIRNGVSLIYSDRCAFEMNYTGGQEIYSTSQVGDNCGLLSPNGVCAEGGVAFWWSDQDFWTWNGGATALPSDDVRAYIFQSGINRQQLSKCVAVLNRKKKQVRFFYPNQSATENNVGMIYQFDQPGGVFSPLAFGRSAGQDAELLQVPVSTDISGMIFYDETGTDANGVSLPYNLELGQTDISNGDKNMDIFGFIPNCQILTGTMNLSIRTALYPNDTPTISGPFALDTSTGRFDLRENGKLVALSLGADHIGANFRLGVPRIDIQPAGARA